MALILPYMIDLDSMENFPTNMNDFARLIRRDRQRVCVCVYIRWGQMVY